MSIKQADIFSTCKAYVIENNGVCCTNVEVQKSTHLLLFFKCSYKPVCVYYDPPPKLTVSRQNSFKIELKKTCYKSPENKGIIKNIEFHR